uniref:Uncharacterized protein n=1 Tax=Anopheles atroparvus TaxID=41427 RepID=A0AAG5DW42_ANOAO
GCRSLQPQTACGRAEFSSAINSCAIKTNRRERGARRVDSPLLPSPINAVTFLVRSTNKGGGGSSSNPTPSRLARLIFGTNVLFSSQRKKKKLRTNKKKKETRTANRQRTEVSPTKPRRALPSRQCSADCGSHGTGGNLSPRNPVLSFPLQTRACVRAWEAKVKCVEGVECALVPFLNQAPDR